jgi:DNA primase
VIDARLEEHDLTSPEGRSAALASAAEALAPVRDSLLGQDYVNYLAGRLQTDFTTVKRAVPRRRGTAMRTADVTKEETAAAPPKRPATPEQKAEWELVRLAAVSPLVRPEARDLLAQEGVLQDQDARRLIGLIVDSGDAVEGELFEAVARQDRALAEVLTGWLVDARNVEQVEYAFREVAARLKEFALGRLISTKKAELRELDARRDAEFYDRLFAEIAELQHAQQQLRARAGDTTDMEA